jgi:glycosyltransferase involved in cell wall biosynthesis
MMPRILMLIEAYPPEYTGAGRQLQALARELVERGVSVQVLTSHEGVADLHESDDIPVTRLACPGPRRAAAFAQWAFAWLLQHRREWDVVHIHGVTRSAYAGILCAKLLRKRAILKFTLLGSDDAATIRAARMGRIKMRGLACADAFIAPSLALADVAADAGLPVDRIHRIPNGVDRTRFCPLPEGERRARRQEWMTPQGWAEEDLLVVFLGAVEARKGVDVLLEAWPRVITHCPQARLIIAGPEMLRDREQARLAKAGASPRSPKEGVAFVGAIPNPESLLAAADVFCLPSRAEGLPNAALEAMACGVACVLSRLEGVTTGLLPQHEAEVLVPPGDADALAKTLTRMLQDDALREAVAKEGTKTAERYELAGIGVRYAALYSELSDGSQKQ